MNYKNYYIYIMANKNYTTLYTGVTSNLIKRVYEHKNKLADGFTKKYNINVLVYYEICSDVESAIAREKQIKKWARNKKISLINTINPTMRDLYFEIIK